VDAVPGVEGPAVLLGGKGFLVLEPPEGGSPRSGSLAEGALSLWLSRELPGAGPVVTTYAGARRVLQLRLDEEGRLLFVLGGRWMMSPDPLATGRFVHVALVWGPTGSSLWVNGARVAQDAVPAPAGGIGEGLRIGWDALAPEELAPAMAVDEVRLRASRPPLDTWYYEAIGHDAFSSEGPVLGRIWPPVRLRMASSGEIELPPGPSSSGGPGDCPRPRRLHLDGMELSTGTDHKTYLSLLFSFNLGAGCSATVPLLVEGTTLERAAFTEMHLSQGRQEEGHHTETLTLRTAGRYSEVGIGNREESSQRGDIEPVVKFWIDWAGRTVYRTVHVEGQLLDARKQPLWGFSVHAFPEQSPRPLVEVKTGPDGWYHLDLTPGTWTVGPRMREIHVEEGAGTIRLPEMQEEPREYWSSPGRRELRGL
jgi:serine/threonine-protein kinase